MPSPLAAGYGWPVSRGWLPADAAGRAAPAFAGINFLQGSDPDHAALSSDIILRDIVSSVISFHGADMDKMKNFGFLLKDMSKRYVLRFEQHARRISLTLTQCKVLVHLDKSEGVSQARLAELTDVDPMMMVRLLDRMEADKLIERRPDPADRRARQLYLLPKAKPLLDEIWRLGELTRTEVFAGVSKADRDTFMRVLERLHQNVCALDAPAAAELTAKSPAAAKPARTAARSPSHSAK